MRNHKFVFTPKIQYELVAESFLRQDKLREANQNPLTFPVWCRLEGLKFRLWLDSPKTHRTISQHPDPRLRHLRFLIVAHFVRSYLPDTGCCLVRSQHENKTSPQSGMFCFVPTGGIEPPTLAL